MTKTVLILGASGKFGRHCAQAFASDGWTVRRFDRKTDDMTKAAIGADVIVNGLNPPNYHNWAVLLPRITSAVIEAAKASGASIILPGNVYPFGARPGQWDETTPHRPNSRKGELRRQAELAYQQAAREGVQTINLRAGDIIDPDAPDTIMSMVIFKGIAKGRLTYPGRSDIPHAWCYAADFGRAAVALANIKDRLARYEDVPFPGQTLTGEQIRTIAESCLNRPVRLKGFGWWMINLASPFWELARELKEMRYLWDTPHSLSATKVHRLLPDFQTTSADAAITAALRAYIHPDKPVVTAPVAV